MILVAFSNLNEQPMPFQPYAWAGNKCLATSEDADKPDAVTTCPEKHLPQLSPALLDSSFFSCMDIAEHSYKSTAKHLKGDIIYSLS